MRKVLKVATITFMTWFTALGAAQAQISALTELNQQAVGKITVAISQFKGGIWQPVSQTTGTGFIIAPDGTVMTAGHLLKDEAYDVCVNSDRVKTDQRCEIGFSWKGQPPNYSLTVIFRSKDQDYMILRLPEATSVLQTQKDWPTVFVGVRPVTGESLSIAGYPNDHDFEANSSIISDNTIRSVIGGFSDRVVTAPDGDGWGKSNVVSAETMEGFSGGPVFNSSNRVIGLLLGSTVASTDGVRPVQESRVLLLSDIVGLCEKFHCVSGMPGYIVPDSGTTATDWRDRLEGGRRAADQVIYGVRLSDLQRSSDPTFLCLAYQTNAQLRTSIS